MIFSAVYSGKKAKKTVNDLIIATGLTRNQVLNAAKPLALGGLFDQQGRDPIEYVKINDIAHIRDRIIRGRGLQKSVKPSNGNRSNPALLNIKQKSGKLKKRPNAKFSDSTKNYDVFISHASEDKDIFVRNLAETIVDAGISVWYDEFSLKWGDSLRGSIDKGLNESRFGIVVLSPDFLKKDWPKAELDGLFQLEFAGQSKILPIWHNLSHVEILKFSPTLAGRMALNSNHPVDDLISKLKELLKS